MNYRPTDPCSNNYSICYIPRCVYVLQFTAAAHLPVKNSYLALIKTGFIYDSSQVRAKVFPLGVPFIRLPFFNNLLYDWRVFPFVKPLLRFAASVPFRQTPTKPIWLHNQLVELPITGPDDWHLISYKIGPRYSPAQAYRIAEVWLDIVRDMKRRENQLFVVQAYPGRMSPSHIEAIDLFLTGISNDNRVKIKLLKEVA